jgi:hypothetical protein
MTSDSIDRYVTRTCECGQVFVEDWFAVDRAAIVEHSKLTGHARFTVSLPTGIVEKKYDGPTGLGPY